MRYLELMTDSEIEEALNAIGERCDSASINGLCRNCPLYGVLPGRRCSTDVMMELWRHWRNLKEANDGRGKRED